MVIKTIILLVLYFLQFTLVVSGRKNMSPNLNKSQEPELKPQGAACFSPLGAGVT